MSTLKIFLRAFAQVHKDFGTWYVIWSLLSEAMFWTTFIMVPGFWYALLLAAVVSTPFAVLGILCIKKKEVIKNMLPADGWREVNEKEEPIQIRIRKH